MITTDYMIISLSACIMCVCVRVCMSVCMRMCMRVCWWTRAWVWGGERVCMWKIGEKKIGAATARKYCIMCICEYN